MGDYAIEHLFEPDSERQRLCHQLRLKTKNEMQWLAIRPDSCRLGTNSVASRDQFNASYNDL